MRVVLWPYWSITVIDSLLPRCGACAAAGVSAGSVASDTADRTATVIRRMIPHRFCHLPATLYGGWFRHKEHPGPAVSSQRPVAASPRADTLPNPKPPTGPFSVKRAL